MLEYGAFEAKIHFSELLNKVERVNRSLSPDVGSLKLPLFSVTATS